MTPSLNRAFVKTGAMPRYLAGFDSTSAMVRALSRFLKGQDFPGMGMAPPSEVLARFVNTLSREAREIIYIYSGFAEAVSPETLGNVRAEVMTEWVTSSYPQRRYPAVAIGSTSGAHVHLGAALGIPWLPQTFLVPVRHPSLSVDEPKPALEWAKKPAERLLEANPELQLHHMFDPNQDRLMLHKMTYFRVKLLRLTQAYKRFIEETLEPGGTLYLVECQRSYPTVKVGERHIFQFGALGGATPAEFYEGSERVERYLDHYNAHVRRWDAPEPDGDRPEAEWGFEAALRNDVEQYARYRGYKVKRIIFEEPEHLSPLVADLYRWWYKERSIVANRLMVESFLLLEPYWALRTASVPFWMKFNMEPSAEWLEAYLDGTDPYDEIYLMLFAHGVDAVGLPPIERWQNVLRRAYRRGEFLGVEEQRYPRDFGVYLRYYKELQEKIPARYPMPGPLSQRQLQAFLDEHGERYPVRWSPSVPMTETLFKRP